MKSVLVIDTPKSCVDCNCEHDSICMVKRNYIQDIWENRPSWCPLKDMPKHLSMVTKDSDPTYYALGYETGWNAVLDYLIMGEDDGD